MKEVYDYYVLDTVSESVVGVLESSNEVLAKKAIFKGLKKSLDDGVLNSDDLLVIRFNECHRKFECFSELVDPNNTAFSDFTNFVFDNGVYLSADSMEDAK